MKSEPQEQIMKRIATIVREAVTFVVRPRPSLYPAPANLMHTRPIFERPA